MKKRSIFVLGALTAWALVFAACTNPAGSDDNKDNGGGSATVSVTSVSLDQETLTMAIGGKKTLIATVLPTNATNKAVTWSSSNTGVATVSAAGEVTAIKLGTATITATTKDGGKTATCEVTVGIYLANFMTDGSFKPTGTTWTILDAGPIGPDQVANLKATMQKIQTADPSKALTLAFPNVTELKLANEYGTFEAFPANFTAIDLSAATTIGAGAFYGCTRLTRVSLPAATSIGNYAFGACTNLTTVVLATGHSGDLTADFEIFQNTPTGKIALTLGTGVSGVQTDQKTWTTNGATYTFKSITVVTGS